MAKHSTKVWDKSPRVCLVCGDWYTPVRHTQKFCPPPKRCRYTNKARLLSKQEILLPIICKDCGTEAVPRASNQVTCGSDCPGKPPLVKVCANAFCGKTFTVTRQVSPNRQIYCSRDCNRAEERFQKYSISSQDYVDLLKSQGGLCAACGDPPALGQRLAVDHDHSCCPGAESCGKCIRGLLHMTCNMTEGLFKDTPERLLKLYEYMTQ